VPDDYRSVVGFFANTIKKAMRLVGGYDILYEKLKLFISEELFEEKIEIADKNILRNLSELPVRKAITDGFKKQINELTVSDKGETKISGEIKLRECKPFVSRAKKYLIPKKSLFGKIIGDSNLELDFAVFLEKCDDIISYAKNYFALGFKLDYQNANGDISNYYPDFIVKKTENEIFIIETKGREELDVPEKMKRLSLWCEDMNKLQTEKTFDYIFVDEESFKNECPKSFVDLMQSFKKYK
jgi:type III restriction enzyme